MPTMTELLHHLKRARNGDREALRTVVEAWWPRMRRWALVATGDPVLAEDAVQEALEGIGCSGLKVQSVGRFLQLDLDAPSEDEARSQVEDMCKRLLVNPNLETFDITVEKLA